MKEWRELTLERAPRETENITERRMMQDVVDPRIDDDWRRQDKTVL